MLVLRGGILMPIGNFPESLRQAILVGIILVGRLGDPTIAISPAGPAQRQDGPGLRAPRRDRAGSEGRGGRRLDAGQVPICHVMSFAYVML